MLRLVPRCLPRVAAPVVPSRARSQAPTSDSGIWHGLSSLYQAFHYATPFDHIWRRPGYMNPKKIQYSIFRANEKHRIQRIWARVPGPWFPWEPYSRYRAGSVTKLHIVRPLKPSSGRRKVADIGIKHAFTSSTKQSRIPGIGHNLTEFARVLVKQARTKAVRGQWLTMCRGWRKGDLVGVKNRTSERTKYCVSYSDYLKTREQSLALYHAHLSRLSASRAAAWKAETFR